ncbi:hypothetical protein SCUCBS95973_003293 [Sporothrix curviconia]|uniref:D-xylulose reductase n=1 Tax=Sporothrix curviconia TaxID=1260050 RepID=A0ABP0BE80_9PEZI
MDLDRRIRTVGYWYRIQAGKDASNKPIVLGHESAGIITKVGSKVTTLKVGDRVAMEPGKYCLRCEFCKAGSYSQCQNVKCAAAEGVDGTLHAYYSLPADVCYKLPDSMSLEEGALPGRGIDLVIDCSGAPVCIQTGIFLAKRRGTYVQVGAGTPNVLVPMITVFVKELRIKGSLRYGPGCYGPGCYGMTIDLVHQGRVQLKPLITHRFPFNQADLAFKTTKDGVGPDGKLAIKTIIPRTLPGVV